MTPRYLLLAGHNRSALYVWCQCQECQQELLDTTWATFDLPDFAVHAQVPAACGGGKGARRELPPEWFMDHLLVVEDDSTSSQTDMQLDGAAHAGSSEPVGDPAAGQVADCIGTP